MSLLQILPLIGIISPILCQSDIKPDVIFDDRNERFDVQDLTSAANQYFENLEGSKLNFRRSGYEKPREDFRRKSKLEKKKKIIETDFMTAIYIAKMRNKDTTGIKRKYRQWREAWRKKMRSREQEGESSSFLKFRKSADLNEETFADHDSRSLEYGGNKEDYETNLALMQKKGESDYRRRMQKHVDYLHGTLGNGLVSRRSNNVPDPENEILLHHAMPFKFKIYGYLLPPKRTK